MTKLGTKTSILNAFRKIKNYAILRNIREFHHFCTFTLVPLLFLSTAFNNGGVATQKKPKKTEKNRKKPVPNLKFAVAFGFFRFFSVFFGFFRFFSVFCGTFSVFFGFFRSELRQEIPVIQKSCQQ